MSKQKAPNSLTEYKKQAKVTSKDATYNNLPTEIKDEIRSQLAVEQGYLCAYCMQRIKNDGQKTKIEHWYSQADYSSEESLDYKNMLLVCRGNEGHVPEEQHCDTKRSSLYDQKLRCNPELHCNPSKREHKHLLNTLSYEGDGTIKSSNTVLDNDLNKVLGLNCTDLIDNRKGTLNALKKILDRKDGKRTPIEIQKLLDTWQQKDRTGKYRAYCGVAIYYLRKKLASL
ncbi:MAG: hypothetical protein PHP00_00350 [Thiotrichaceae bacterium]|nr:hypothetical protein [Thiotrichaceae bacterium]